MQINWLCVKHIPQKKNDIQSNTQDGVYELFKTTFKVKDQNHINTALYTLTYDPATICFTMA